ncbi:hypothetical protein O6H91_02G017000 [Diphasiastrum complanatum]|uniref:Uncharacterized protein n=2 Tax=Diphasiastrum complanatum TaxID=34168 RepID=A0ACC2EDG4_DIPCM|nr:hypothetical protein O6H91_02G017000 [Diphasiastrum complanatum]
MGFDPVSGVGLATLWLVGGCCFFTASALPLCLNLEAPVPIKYPLEFCSDFGYRTGCCDSQLDKQLNIRFNSMNITSQICSEYIKEILCAQCDAFAAELHGPHDTKSSPNLCNSNASSVHESKGYCSDVWDACRNVSITDSPFSPHLLNSAPSHPRLSANNDTLSAQWPSRRDFCAAFAPPASDPYNASFCFDGGPYQFQSEKQDTAPKGICLQKVELGAYINMIPHPDGSNRVFLASQSGKVWLATLPEKGSSNPITLNESAPYLDISNLVVDNEEFGFLALAFHPNFLQNGRLFVSFNCDKTIWADCAGKCSCTSDVGCDPSQVGNAALKISSKEVRRIFTLELPYVSHHAGQILFGPKDAYLYFMLGDGGGTGDPFNFAQNNKSLLGKILRLDVDNMPTTEEIANLGLWGNYTIPDTNPFKNERLARPEIWALGFRNPWRCSFDSLKPLYFYCADVGQETYEEVNLVTKGGNYGWRVFEGPNLYNPPASPGGNTTESSILPIFPILGYYHNQVDPKQGASAIIGGYVSRSEQDPCIYGRYLYADLYGSVMWAGLEFPPGSGNYSATTINFTCSASSHFPCEFVGNSTIPKFQYIFSWGQDNDRNLYILSNGGIFKVISPTACDFTCKKSLPSQFQPNSAPVPTRSSTAISSHASRSASLSILSSNTSFMLGLIIWAWLM